MTSYLLASSVLTSRAPRRGGWVLLRDNSALEYGHVLKSMPLFGGEMRGEIAHGKSSHCSNEMQSATLKTCCPKSENYPLPHPPTQPPAAQNSHFLLAAPVETAHRISCSIFKLLGSRLQEDRLFSKRVGQRSLI